MSMTIIRQRMNGPGITILDQTIVSATNFFASLIIARALGIQEFGIYSLFFIFLILLDTFQHSIFSAPMMSLAPAKEEPSTQENYFSSIMMAQTITSIVIALLCYALGLTVAHLTGDPHSHNYLIPFALCVFIFPTQEWVRRYLFTKQATLHALYLDTIRSMIQIGLLVYCAVTDTISVGQALYILAFSSAIVYLVGPARHLLSIDIGGIRPALRENWNHARHLLPSSLLEWTRLQGFMLIGGLLIGVQAIGAIRAAQNILGPLNIIYQAADNIFPIEGARRLAQEGEKNTIRYFKMAATRGILILSIPCILISFSAQWIMEFLYGDQFTSYYQLIIWQAISLLLIFSLKVGTSFMRSFHITKPILMSSLIGTGVLITIITPLGILFDENGVMLAKISSEVFSLYLITYSIRKLSRDKHA